MPAALKFRNAVGQLEPFLRGDKSYTLTTDQAAFDDALKALIRQLPGQSLALTDAKMPDDGTPPTTPPSWTVSGTPTTPWPVPGFKNTTATVSGATVTLTVTQSKKDDPPADEPSFGVAFDGEVDLGGTAPVALSVGMESDGSWSVEVGDPKGKIHLPIGNLLAHFDINDALDGFPLETIFISAVSLSLENDEDDPGKPPHVTDGSIVGSVDFGGGVVVQLTIALSKGHLSEPDVKLTWPSADQKAGSCTINDLLDGMKVPFHLPGPLNRPLKSFAIQVRYIHDKDTQLNPNDTRRIELVSPATSPDVMVTWSKNAGGKYRSVMRAGWGSLPLKTLPVVGDHLPGSFDPLLLLMVTEQLGIKEAASLAGLSKFKGLETLGAPADRLKKDPTNAAFQLPPGIHCAGLFDIPDHVTSAFHFPLYRFSPATTPDGGGKDKSKDKDKDKDKEDKDGTDDGLQPDSKTTPLAVQKNVGPVHVDSVAFRFEDETVSVLFNVVLEAGGLAFELVGLRLGFDIEDREPKIGVDGLLITFKGGSVNLAGGFVRDTSHAATDWGGTALVRVGEAFAVQALGAFSDGDPKKMFVYCHLKRQLGGPPWLIITGLAGGFGYNRSLVIPAVDQVDEFPFVKIANDLSRGTPDKDAAPVDPQGLWDLMSGIETYLGPSDGTDFVTAGFTATSFGLVDSTVVLAVTFGSSFEFVLLGSSSLSIPKDNPIARAEIELVASVQPDAGLVAIDGLLAPGSYVLSSACHLTGGFAFHLWFSGRHAGDFVLSIGGYNAKYSPPAYYPAVPRLAFVWKISDEVLVTGWSYFALTPTSVQAGGGLSLVLDAGPLRAWCNMLAEFEVQWTPLFYDIHFAVDFGVSFRISLLFCSFTITIDIGADVEMWGPPFSGHADIHLWFVSFGVDFGAGASKDRPKTHWEELLATVVAPTAEASGGGTALRARQPPHGRALADDPPTTSASQPVQIVAVNGIADAPQGSGVDWIADPAHTVLSVVTSLPAATMSLNGKHPGGLPAGAITLTAQSIENTPVANPELLVTIEARDPIDAWRATAVTGQVPSALWGTGADGSALVTALTGMRLDIVPERPHDSRPIEQSILLFHDVDHAALPWPTPAVPDPGTFDPASDGPVQTIGKAAGGRTALLQSLVAKGLLDDAAVAGIDVRFVTADQPCFMDQPVLCRLGADKPA